MQSKDKLAGLKILMLPAWLTNRHNNPKDYAAGRLPSGSFFYEQALAIHQHGGATVDILFPTTYSVVKALRKRLPLPRGVDVVEREGGETWFGYYPYFLPLSRPYLWRRYGERLFARYVAKRGMPNLLWSNGVLWSAFLANHLARKHGLPYFVVEHADVTIRKDAGKKIARNRDEVLRLLSGSLFTAAPCQKTADNLRAFFGDKLRVDVLPNVLAEEFYAGNVAAPPAAAPFVFFHAGRMDDNKNQRGIVSAFAEFCKQTPNAILRLAGDGPQRERVLRQIAGLGLESKTQYLGFLTRAKLAAELRRANAFVTASKHETFNVSLIEALACGLPCVSTAAGVAQEVINQSNGAVINNGSPAEILRGMSQVFQNAPRYNAEQIRADALQQFGGKAVAEKLQALLLRRKDKSADFIGRDFCRRLPAQS